MFSFYPQRHRKSFYRFWILWIDILINQTQTGISSGSCRESRYRYLEVGTRVWTAIRQYFLWYGGWDFVGDLALEDTLPCRDIGRYWPGLASLEGKRMAECPTRAQELEKQLTAIIGGGIGGTSSAYFLRKMFGETANIDLYNIGNIGGRTATVKLAGREYEAGGSIIHSRNKYMVDFVDQLGLSKRNKVSSSTGFHNGEEYVLIESQWKLVTLGKLLWRYGLDFFRLYQEVDVWLKQFDKIYTLQEEGKAFKTVEDLVGAMGGQDFINGTRDQLIPLMRSHGYSDRFIGEVIAAATRVSYGQFEDMNVFAGLVGVAGVQPGLWAVQDGNHKVSEALLNESKVNIYKSLVTIVELNATSKPRESFIVHSVPWEQSSGEAQKKSKDRIEYDIVIVDIPQHGAPPTQHPIKFVGFDAKSHVPDGQYPGEYQRTVANFIDGVPQASAFGLDKAESLPDGTIMVVEPKLRFRSLAKNFPVDITADEAAAKDVYVYKVFSEYPLDDERVDALFETVREKTYVDWLAYPRYGSTNQIPPFELHSGLYYVNAIEWAASAIEMSVIGSRNTALLAYQYWTGQRSTGDAVEVDDKDEL